LNWDIIISYMPITTVNASPIITQAYLCTHTVLNQLNQMQIQSREIHRGLGIRGIRNKHYDSKLSNEVCRMPRRNETLRKRTGCSWWCSLRSRRTLGGGFRGLLKSNLLSAIAFVVQHYVRTSLPDMRTESCETHSDWQFLS
jgi:hypothetical protein